MKQMTSGQNPEPLPIRAFRNCFLILEPMKQDGGARRLNTGCFASEAWNVTVLRLVVQSSWRLESTMPCTSRSLREKLQVKAGSLI